MSGKALIESLTPRGHLEIVKRYLDGREEVVLSDHNMITIGMGVNFAMLFGNEDATVPNIKRYQFGYFQAGKNTGTVLTSSAITGLATPLAQSEYGGNLTLSNHNKVTTGGGKAPQTFVEFTQPMVTRPANDQVQFTIDLDTNTANGVSLTEVGLFATDPFGHDAAHGGAGIKGSLLCAYRAFTAIAKSSTFSLTFKWTLNF